MLTKTELIHLCNLTVSQLHDILKGKSYREAMQLRNYMQRAMTIYRDQVPEETKNRFLKVTNKIEHWCADAFFTLEIPRYIKQKNLLTRMPMKAARHVAKINLKGEWSQFERRYAY